MPRYRLRQSEIVAVRWQPGTQMLEVYESPQTNIEMPDGSFAPAAFIREEYRSERMEFWLVPGTYLVTLPSGLCGAMSAADFEAKYERVED